MPSYIYKCSSCEHSSIYEHGVFEDPPQICTECKTEKSLYRDFNQNFAVVTKSTAGKEVKKFIEEAREEIRQERENQKRKQ